MLVARGSNFFFDLLGCSGECFTPCLNIGGRFQLYCHRLIRHILFLLQTCFCTSAPTLSNGHKLFPHGSGKVLFSFTSLLLTFLAHLLHSSRFHSSPSGSLPFPYLFRTRTRSSLLPTLAPVLYRCGGAPHSGTANDNEGVQSKIRLAARAFALG